MTMYKAYMKNVQTAKIYSRGLQVLFPSEFNWAEAGVTLQTWMKMNYPDKCCLGKLLKMRVVPCNKHIVIKYQLDYFLISFVCKIYDSF